ncbi:MAG TPA: hypothetical protein VGY55_09805 [Pirellulales bacterium]|jgi:hypothetical protein|nr:hypothetical protein [Pirellulales bacterium]
MADGERKNGQSLAPRRVVLLGASNLTRGISTVIETAQGILGGQLEVLAALGHGRSYGMASRVLGRELPGILQCGLWNALSSLPPAPTAALVTDIGNDLLYGASVGSILDWVGASFDRLALSEARTIVTLLPLESIARLSKRRFLLMRTVNFPKCRAGLDEVLLRAGELNAGLIDLARARRIPTVALRGAWYGFDPIHIRLRFWKSAWREILSGWCDAPAAAAFARGSLTRWLYLRSRAPEARRLFGVARRAPQPSGRLRDGTTIALY